MTQQPYAPYPVPPQQQYPTYPAPAQQIPQQPQFPAYPPQQVAQQPFPTQQPPAQPLANGTLDDFYNQPSTGGGPSISWKNKPEGTTYAGIVARDVTHSDVQQETDFQTKQPKFYRDGRPKFVMKVPLRVQPSPEFPEGEAVFFVKGQARDELVRAMNEAGCSGAPVAGAGIVVTLVQRKASGQGMNPANIVRITYQPPQGAQGTGAPSPAPVPEQQQQAQPVPQAAPAPAQQQYAPPVQQVQPPQAAPVPQAPAPVAQQPAPQQAAAPQPPSDLSAEQQALLARLTGQQG